MATRNSRKMVEDIEEEMEEVVEGGRKVAEEIQHGAEVATEHLKQYAGRAKEVYESEKHKSLADVEESISGYVKQNPGKVIVGAVAAGFLAGFLLRGR